MLPKFLVATLALSILAACVPPAPDDDVVIDYEVDTVMGQIQDAGVLRVAFEDMPPFAFVDQDEQPQGFALEFARDLGDSLGVETDFVATTDPIQLVEDDGADVAFPSFAITERVVREAAFSDPYFVAHQRILVKGGVNIDAVDDLTGRKVCSFIDPVTEVALDELNPDIQLQSETSFEDCEEAIRKGHVDAVTAADVFLMSVIHEDDSFAMTGDELATEGFGAVVEDGAASWRLYVDNVLWEAKDEGRWSRWYDEWIAPYTDEPDSEPPKMTLEEAAALFPISQEEV
jgi:ABC-type amino acid transport substrate-binding protein